MSKTKDRILYYVHDPMCSWCYGFRPVLERLLLQLPASITLVRLLGGLAPDNDEPMPGQVREYVINTWRRIERIVPDTYFNYSFWERCSPRRSTFPACRAVIAARLQRADADELMTHAIQDAYYREARNPSDVDTLVQLAQDIGLDVDCFRRDLGSQRVESLLQEEIRFVGDLDIDGFPSLVLELNGSRWRIPVDYHSETGMLDLISSLVQIHE